MDLRPEQRWGPHRLGVFEHGNGVIPTASDQFALVFGNALAVLILFAHEGHVRATATVQSQYLGRRETGPKEFSFFSLTSAMVTIFSAPIAK